MSVHRGTRSVIASASELDTFVLLNGGMMEGQMDVEIPSVNNDCVPKPTNYLGNTYNTDYLWRKGALRSFGKRSVGLTIY